jgi:two-component system sensor histidine kinase HydH
MKNRQISIIIILLSVITIGHYTIPHSLVYLHDISRRLYYLPIILSAYWFGKRGGILSALSITVLYFPHALFSWYGKNPRYFDNMIEIVFFNVVGYLIGTYIEKKNQQKTEAENQAQKLHEAYIQLEQNTEKIMLLEDKLRFADRLATMGELAASLAHEIRNPLGGIQGAAEILRKRIDPGDKDSEFVEIQLKEIQRLNKVVENYLSLSKSDQKEFKNEHLSEILKNTLDLLRVSVRKSEIRIEFDLSSADGIILNCDPVRIQQALLNLAFNAFHAMPNGGILILKVITLTDPNNFQIVIKDTGHGIAKKDQNKIFNTFFSTRTDGTGLGLSITRRIIEEHQGKINFKSGPEGTEFLITLPEVKTLDVHPDTKINKVIQ